VSWEATNWARTVETGSPARKVLLLLLADLADESHSCYPGQERLAADSEQSVKSVSRHLAVLEEMGVIRREARYVVSGGKKVRTSDRFYLPLDQPGGRFAPAEQDPDLPDNLSGRSGGDLPDKSDPTYRTPVSREPLVEPLEPLLTGGGETPGSARATAIPPESPVPSVASLRRDEHGPLDPWCRRHQGGTTEPCGACAARREAYDAAELRRAEAERRALNDAAIQADRQAKGQAAPPEIRARRAAKTRNRLRAARKPAQEPLTGQGAGVQPSEAP